MNDVTLREAPLKFTSSLDQGDEARKADTLNLLPYAEAMRDFIHECESPMSIGIQGDWGIGRTSLMNMLRGSGDGQQSGLLDGNLCKTISLDSWPYAQFDQHDNMAVACLYALTNKLGQALENEPDIEAEELKTRLDLTNLDTHLSQARNRLGDRRITNSVGHGCACQSGNREQLEFVDALLSGGFTYHLRSKRRVKQMDH